MIEIRVDDLAFTTADAIAWPVTAELRATTPLLRRLEAAGGDALDAQRRLQQPLPVGSAVVTGAGALGVELLIHAVVASDTEPVSAGGVRRAMVSALQRAVDWRMEHVAFTPFGVGAGALELEESADIMLEAITHHRSHARFPARITLVVETSLEQEVFSSMLARVSE